MEIYLAHSTKGDCPPQSYADHIKGVYRRASKYADEAGAYAARSQGQFEEIVKQSALLHDLGKLDDSNQAALRAAGSKYRHLPVNHVDAGSAALIMRGNLYAALAVYAHHKGLPDMEAEWLKGEAIFRDRDSAVRSYVDKTLTELLRRHKEIFSDSSDEPESFFEGNQAVFFRMVLSCLADADHTDTATAYRQAPEKEALPQLRAKERLAALNRYISELSGNDERICLRKEMYLACRDAKVNGGFSVCDSPVGSGKTTAVMAHLLQQAMLRKSRRIFVILPYTSIIQQSVDVYRRSLVLSGERPDEVVAELHCRADFQDKDTRYLTTLWRAPIVVTTAVAFFETLASNCPATLRRFHELPGSVIFIDEAHNALPLKLLPIAWRWMNVLAEEWSCYWVLASGSLVRFWQLDSLRQIEMPLSSVSELVNADLQEKLMQYEHDRVVFTWRTEALSRRELIEWVQSAPGPRLLILNTVQSAAVIADDLAAAYGRECVEHLSTALTPEDRSAVIERVKARLEDKSDANWTLVATSCVEAGVDFSFRTGFRELSSLLSLLQAAGRVNRHGLFQGAEMRSFSLQEDSMLKQNLALDVSREVLRHYFNKGIRIVPEFSTKSMNDEIIRDESCINSMVHLMDLEERMQFQAVNDQFEMIDSNTVSAVVDIHLSELIACGKGDWQLLQKKIVSIRREKVREWNLKEIATGVYQWTLRYDSFLGYMRGVLDIEKQKHDRFQRACF